MTKNISICNQIIKRINNILLNNTFIEIKNIDNSQNNYEKLINCIEFKDFKKKLNNDHNINVYVNKIPLYDNNKYKITWKKYNNKIIIDI